MATFTGGKLKLKGGPSAGLHKTKGKRKHSKGNDAAGELVVVSGEADEVSRLTKVMEVVEFSTSL